MEYASALWRPLVASALMGAVISRLVDIGPPYAGVGNAVMQLLMGVTTGMLSYPLILAALWLISGRPDSIEVQITRWAAGVVRARRARDAAA
jgi:hypothetical protein